MPIIFAGQTPPSLKQFYLFVCSLFLYAGIFAQQPDSVRVPPDSMAQFNPVQKTPLQNLLEAHAYLNTEAAPASLLVTYKNRSQSNTLFYLLAGLIFFFGVVRTLYQRYFSTLFRVFFNSSLRQSQLTDQLLQSKLPSLFFNLIFLVAGGFYIYFLFLRLGAERQNINWLLLGSCIGIFTFIYLGKYLTLKFVGWVTGFSNEADTYIFVLFLINKIIGICLLPVIVILSFSLPSIGNIVLVCSFLLIGIMLLLRFIRSYSLLEHKLKVSRFHFLLYVLALEILPLMLIYKGVSIFIVKTL
ncbi:MAG: DUF4271 domain-containing protein [Gloeobacteraceae cyanobacterium ES-bin-316]|nr:DUF4271 domain-containing protein [Ferruginibacter sp.]